MRVMHRRAPEGRQNLAHGASRGWTMLDGSSPGGAEGRRLFRPYGAVYAICEFPRLAPWANFWRPSGA
jgi:hypothetical protein